MPNRLSLLQAAQRISPNFSSIRDAELALAQAIEHGDLRANIQRWATEQWSGKNLPGNLNHLETFLDESDLDAWSQANKTKFLDGSST